MFQRVFLPSNSSMLYFPNNTSSNYIVKVPHMFDNESSGIIQCALSQIIFPSTYKNVREGLNGVTIFTVHEGQEHSTFYKVPTGYYENVNQLIKAIHSSVHPLAGIADRPKSLIGYDEFHKKVWIKVSSKFFVKFQHDLAKILGFVPDKALKGSVKEKHRIFSSHRPKIHEGHIYLYCNIVKPQIIGEVTAPLLRILNWEHSSIKKSISQTFTDLFYIPLNGLNFDTIHLYLMDEAGYPLEFEEGENTIVVLEFEEKKKKKTI